jgi:hypothetical protein
MLGNFYKTIAQVIAYGWRRCFGSSGGLNSFSMFKQGCKKFLIIDVMGVG